MTHIDETLLNEYLDQQLDASGYERVNAHLAGCKDCRERLADAQQLFRALTQLPEEPLMVDLSQQVVARLSAEFKPRPIPRWTVPIIALQMVAALALVVWVWPSLQPVLETAGRALPQTAEQILPDLSLSGAVAPLINGLESMREFSEAISANSTLPIFEGFLIIGLAFILWLAGSSLLLRQSLIVQQKS